MENTKRIILVAGGTGFVGKHLIKHLSKNYEVRILTRNENLIKKQNFYFWDPYSKKIDEKSFENVTHIINLCGEGIADKRWTKKRKKELIDSRTIPASFLFEKTKKSKTLKQYITASGVNCYPLHKNETFSENSVFGDDFVSQIVKKWEEKADLFSEVCKVVKLRIGFVIANNEGGTTKIEKPIKMGFGSYIGSGNQLIPWIHISDLVKMFHFSITNELDGAYHAISGVTSNKNLTDALAKKNKKRIFLPNLPAWFVRFIFGELSQLLLEGINVSNEKIKNTGFIFENTDIERACLV